MYSILVRDYAALGSLVNGHSQAAETYNQKNNEQQKDDRNNKNIREKEGRDEEMIDRGAGGKGSVRKSEMSLGKMEM